MIIGPRGLADGSPQFRRMSNVNILTHPLGMDPWAAAALGRMQAPPDDFVQRLDAGARIYRADGVQDRLDALWITGSFSRPAARLNLVPWTGTVTNVLTNSEFVGATPGVVPDGVILTGFAAGTGNNYEIQGVDIVNGQRFLRLRLYGTSVGVGAITFNVHSDAIADVGQRWTTSASVELVSGSWVAGLSVVTLRLNGEGGGSNFIPGARAQYTNTRVVTTTFAGSNLVLRFSTPTATTTPVTYDVVLRIGLPQLVRMDVPSNYIPTNGAAASQVQTLARFDLAEMNNPVWTAWTPGAPGGFVGGGTVYLDANADPSFDFTRASLNSATYGAWVSSETITPNSVLGATVSSIPVVPRSDVNTTYCRVHSNVSLTVPGATTSLGLTAGNRSAANALQLYRNGVSIGANTAASSAMTTELWVGRNVGTYYPGQVSAAFAGASLTAAQHLALYRGIAATLGVTI
jgi:hypothetical protein